MRPGASLANFSATKTASLGLSAARYESMARMAASNFFGSTLLAAAGVASVGPQPTGANAAVMTAASAVHGNSTRAVARRRVPLS